MNFKTIDELLEAEGHDETCESCEYYREWFEPHPNPFSFGSCYEGLAACDANDDSECPRLKHE